MAALSVFIRTRCQMSEAEHVAVRPTIALLILHSLVRQVMGTAVHIPMADGVAETAAPAAHCVHVFGEVEQAVLGCLFADGNKVRCEAGRVDGQVAMLTEGLQLAGFEPAPLGLSPKRSF